MNPVEHIVKHLKNISRMILIRLRILDCKVDHDKDIMKTAPKMKDYLNEEAEGISLGDEEELDAYIMNLSPKTPGISTLLSSRFLCD